MEEMFGRGEQVRVLGQEAKLQGFDLENDSAIVALCQVGKHNARVALESVEFPDLTPTETRWLKAWQQFSRRLAQSNPSNRSRQRSRPPFSGFAER
jgi:hypothetical protein